MVTSNERKGLIAVIALLGVLILIVVCTQRCGSEPVAGVNTEIADSVASINDSINKHGGDTIIYGKKHSRKRKSSKQKSSKSSYKERDPLAEEEHVNR